MTFFVLLALFGASTGCKPDSAPKAGQNSNNTAKPGDQPSCGDCGGADPESSTPEEVKAAIESAFHQLKTNSFFSHSGGTVFQALAQTEYGLRFALSMPDWKSAHRSSVWELAGAAYADRIKSDKLAVAFAEQLTDEGQILDEINKKVRNLSELSDLLSQSRLSFDMNNCAADFAHKVAAVDKHGPGAQICFNIEQMMKFPSSTLEQQAKVYLVHEVMHILGYREPEAVKIHKLFHYQSSLGRHLNFMEEAFRVDHLASNYVGNLVELISMLEGPYSPHGDTSIYSHQMKFRRKLSQVAENMAGLMEIFDRLVHRSDGVVYDRRSLHKLLFDNYFVTIPGVQQIRMSFTYEKLAAEERVRLRATEEYRFWLCRFSSVYRRMWGFVYSPQVAQSFFENPFVINSRMDPMNGKIKLADFCSGLREKFPELESGEVVSNFVSQDEAKEVLKKGIGTFYWDFFTPVHDLTNPPK